MPTRSMTACPWKAAPDQREPGCSEGDPQARGQTCSGHACAQLRDALRKAAVPQTFRRGDVIVHQGDPPAFVGLVLEGRVKVVSHSAGGRDVTLEVLAEGQLFGLIPVLDGAPYPTAVVGVEDGVVGRVAAARFEGVLREEPGAALHLLRSLSARTRRLTEALTERCTADVQARLAHKLLDLAAGERTVAVTRQELAELAGTTVETAIRTTRRWERDQLVRLGRGCLSIEDPPGLARIAAGR